MRSLLLGALVLAGLSSAAAQQRANARFRHLSVDDGLSQSSVTAMVQDRWGFMWFGTQDGLNRYDGHQFIVFKHDSEDPSSLSNNYIWDLHIDRQGTLWVGTQAGGLDRFDPTTESFVHYRHDPDDPDSLGSNRIRSIAEDKDGFLWTGSEEGLERFDPRTGTAVHFRHDPDDPDSLGHDSILAVYVDRRGTLWIGTDRGGLDRLDPGSEKFVHYRNDPENLATLSNDRVRSILEDKKGRIWIGTYEGGLNRLDPVTGNIIRFVQSDDDRRGISHDRVRALWEDTGGRLWVGTDAGLDRYISDSEGFEDHKYDPADRHSLSAGRVLAIYQDRGGVLWVATQDGLNSWNPDVADFAHYRRESEAESSLTSNIVMALSQSADGAIWIGTYGGGLDKLERESNRYVHHRANPDDPGSLSDDRVMSLLHDRSGALWIGTFEGGLDRLRPGARRFEHYRHDPADPASLSANAVTSIHEDAKGNLWIGTYRGGLNRLDRERGTFERFRSDPGDPATLSDDRVMVIRSDRDGVLWIGTEDGGLNRFDPRTGVFTRFRSDPAEPSSLGSNFIWSIHEGRDGTLWIGAQGGGLHRWSLEDRRALRSVFTRYTEKDGLRNESIYGILEDDRGMLWLSTNRGVSRFDPEVEKFTNFDTTHGLQNNEFNFGASFAGPTGEMLFGGNNGFNVFDPVRVDGNDHVPPMVLTGIFKMNERVPLEQPTPEVEKITLGHKDHTVSFEFAAMDFTAPQRNRYAYKLEGFDDDWVQLGNSRRATYTSLPPGSYIFRMRGANNDDVWNEDGARLAVEVLPPPWKTWWAYSLYGLVLVVVVFRYTRTQAEKLRREAEYSRKLEADVQARTRELATRNTELQEANSKLQQASLTDSLTGLRNRRYLMTEVDKSIALVERFYTAEGHSPDERTPAEADFLFMMLDLDGLKGINDTYGHMAGDMAILQVRDLLTRECRKSDTIIRWGGDEFLIVGRNMNMDHCENLAERLRDAVAGHEFDLELGEPIRLSCSVGFAAYPFLLDAPTLIPWEQVITIADRALYIAKMSGRNAWVNISSTGKTPAENLVQLINENIEELLRLEAIDVRTSLEKREELVWARK